MKLKASAFLAALCVFLSPKAGATTVYVTSVGDSAVQVIIDGSVIRTLAIGEGSPEGVTLKAIDAGIATFEVDRRTIRLGMGGSTTARAAIKAGRDGHFRTTAYINGIPVTALIDTGASYVVMGSATAARLGIPYRTGRQQFAEVGAGRVTSYSIFLPRVQVGDIAVDNVSCSVLEGAQIAPNLEVLVGNSFLSQVRMVRSGDTMTLTRRNGL